jgi:streptogramin lyase
MRLTQLRHLARLVTVMLVTSCASDHDAPPPAMAQYDVVLLHTLGGAEDGPATLSDIRGIVVDPQGRFIVLDFATQQIEMFDSAGTHLRTIGRRGAGPGELAKANGLLRAPDGTLWVNDPSNKRFTVFDAEGDYLRSVPVNITGYGFIWEAWFDADGSLYEPISVRQDTTYRERLQRFHSASRRVDTLAVPCEGMLPPSRPNFFFVEYHRGNMSMGIPYTPEPIEVYDRRGHAWCGVTSDYTMRRVPLTGGGDTLTLKGTRTATPVSQSERDSAIAQIHESVAKVGARDPDYSRIPDLKPIINSVNVDDIGRVWVSLMESDSGQVWELFKDGVQVGVVHSPVKLSRWHPLILRDDRMIGVTKDSNDVLVIVSGKLQRRGSVAGQ